MTVDEQAGGAERTRQQPRIGESPGHRTANDRTSGEPAIGDQPSGFDIGVASTPGAVVNGGGRGAGQRRRLPVWMMVVSALLVGWLFGSLLGSSQSNSSATTASTPTPEAVRVRATMVVEPAPVSVVGDGALSLPASTLVIAPANQGPPGASMLLIDEAGSDEITLDGGVVTAQPLAVDNGVAVIAGGTVYIVPTSAGASIAVTEADVLMPGTESGTLWAVRPNRRTVQLIDVGSRSVRATYDLSTVGTPLASYDGGLIVAPDIERFGPFALWSPARGIERIWLLEADASFVDAIASTIVLQTDRGLASYDTVTGSLSQTDVRLDAAALDGAKISPNGTAVAIPVDATNGAEMSIAVVDLATGDIADTFETGPDTNIWWVSNEQMLHHGVDDDQQIWLRDTRLSFSTRLHRPEMPFVWMTLGD